MCEKCYNTYSVSVIFLWESFIEPELNLTFCSKLISLPLTRSFQVTRQAHFLSEAKISIRGQYFCKEQHGSAVKLSSGCPLTAQRRAELSSAGWS